MSLEESTRTSAQRSGGLTALSPQLSYVSYRVNDIDRSLAFYVGVMGMAEQLRMPLGGGMHEVVLSFPERKGMGLILMWDEHKERRYTVGDGYSRFILRVSDLAAAMAHLVEHGTTVVKSIRQTPVLDYALVQDPDGYVIELLQMKRA